MSWSCFLLTPTTEAFRFLRRYSTSNEPNACPAHPAFYGHSATVEIERGPLERSPEGFIPTLDWPKDDPRWPASCACGYRFREKDLRVVDQHEIYLTPDGREVVTHLQHVRTDRAAPAGAMWDAPWLLDWDGWTGPDGRSLMLRLPDGYDWMIDGPAQSGGKWTRSGEPPLITARPSILSPNYHGWLTDGVLSDDLDGRTYP